MLAADLLAHSVTDFRRVRMTDSTSAHYQIARTGIEKREVRNGKKQDVQLSV